MCRICLGAGPGLFSPCACNGSMRYVHRRCLDEWRGRSANPESFRRCEQCHTLYRTRRPACAVWLERREATQCASAFVLAAWISLSAATLHPFGAHRVFYDVVRWRPPPWWIVDAGVDGMLGVASAGVALRIRDVWRENQNHSWGWLLSLLSALASHDTRILRVFAVCGLAAALSCVQHVVARRAQRLIVRFSTVLDYAT